MFSRLSRGHFKAFMFSRFLLKVSNFAFAVSSDISRGLFMV